MYPDVKGCCPKGIRWIFVYKNNEILSICENHFFSMAHRSGAKDVVNFQTKIRYEPETIFAEHPLPAPQEEPSVV